MHYWVCADDTDMPGTAGTGRILQGICTELEQKNMGICSPISRHQLFVHRDIPYTSHNSAMCLEIDLAEEISLPRLTEFMARRIEGLSPDGADPGLCIAGPLAPEARDRLIHFGTKAKQSVLSKEEALDLAQDLGIHLSEHGGTGQGVIGALAGLGLRLSGNDGRYRGWHYPGKPGEVLGAGELCRFASVGRLVSTEGKVLAPEIKVVLASERIKTMRRDHRQVVVVAGREDREQTGILYRTLSRDEIRKY